MSFEYKNLKITRKAIPADGTTEVSVAVISTGRIKGDEQEHRFKGAKYRNKNWSAVE